MYYTVGSQCPKIPIPDRVPIAELFSSEWLLLNLNSFSQDLPLCHFFPCQREESDRILALAWNLGQWLLAASLGMSTSILLTSAFSSDQKGILFTADSILSSSNAALASAISFVLFYFLLVALFGVVERPRMASLKEDDRHAGKEKEGDVA